MTVTTQTVYGVLDEGAKNKKGQVRVVRLGDASAKPFWCHLSWFITLPDGSGVRPRSEFKAGRLVVREQNYGGK